MRLDHEAFIKWSYIRGYTRNNGKENGNYYLGLRDSGFEFRGVREVAGVGTRVWGLGVSGLGFGV